MLQQLLQFKVMREFICLNLKNIYLYNLYYSDTYSIYIGKPLSNELVGKDIGKLKLEYVFKEVVFLASKVYGSLKLSEELLLIIEPLLRLKD